MAIKREHKSIAQLRLEQARELEELSESIEKLRVQFDRYFMGLEKIPPVRDLEALERAFRRTRLREAKNTATRFKFQNLNARMVTYRQYWTRVMRMIEEGTFRRDRNAVPPGAPPPPPASAASRANGDEMRDLYEQWSSARAEVGLKPVDYDKFAAKMKATRDKHLEQLKASDVRYAVKIKDGKVSLTAKPIK